jgi:hypothetical protein
MPETYASPLMATYDQPMISAASGAVTIGGAPAASAAIVAVSTPCRGVYISIYAIDTGAYGIVAVGLAAGDTSPEGIVLKASSTPNTAPMPSIFIPVADANMVTVFASVAGAIFHYVIVK